MNVNNKNCLPEIPSIRIMLFVILLIPLPSFSKPLTGDEEMDLLDKCSRDGKEQLIEKKFITGKLDSFVWGDLFHSEVHGKNGDQESFVSGHDDSCFLAQHKEEWLYIEYDLECQSLPDHAGYVPANVITQIKAKNSDFISWRKQSGGSDDKCEKLVEKYTRQP